MSLEPKHTLMFRIYQVLCDHSDESHPLKQQDVIDYLYRDYGVECERKAVGRNISFLQECGIDIVSNRKGCYISNRKFENSELHLLIDSVLCSRHINPKHSRDLIEKLVSEGGKNFKHHVKYVYSVNEWNKSENMAFMLNIELVDEAISKKCKVSFWYNKYGLDKKLHHAKFHLTSPYYMILHNQRYYLMACDNKWKNIGFYRMDKITEMQIVEDQPCTPLNEVEGYEHGIDFKRLTTSRPYMFNDTPEHISMLCENWMVDELIDWFGTSFVANAIDDQHVEVSLTVSPAAMEYWAMQYGKNVEILSPKSLRDKLLENAKSIISKYE